MIIPFLFAKSPLKIYGKRPLAFSPRPAAKATAEPETARHLAQRSFER